jgi:hypothetical protein
VIALVVLRRLRYELALRDLPEMFLVRGLVFSHETVRAWEAKLAPALAGERRRGEADPSPSVYTGSSALLDGRRAGQRSPKGSQHDGTAQAVLHLLMQADVAR